jgi:hypothetical protein
MRILQKHSGRLGSHLLVALVVFSLGSTAPGLPTVSATPGIRVLEPLPEPAGSQFLDGPRYVPPAALPATDLGTRALRAVAAPTYTCPGYGGIETPNPPSALMQDIFTWGAFRPFKVGNGRGNVNWKLNPYSNPSWYMYLHSLRWLGQGITAGSLGDLAALGRVSLVAHDWVRDNPYSWKANVGAWESTMHRTNVLVCLRQAVLAANNATTLPASYAWLDLALHNHARFLIGNWSGAWNHGTMESIALFGVGCLLRAPLYRTVAVDRLGRSITTAIDSQGSTNEQSTSYAQFNYALWGRSQEVLRACNVDPGATIAARRSLMATWLAHATDSRGVLHQLGDSETVATVGYPGTPMQYVASGGATGVPPRARVAVYSKGYVFGRSGWGGPGLPYSAQSTYSIRYGERRANHGHSDHMALTYTARGRTILVDTGHTGYKNDVWRAHARGASAHSSMAAETLPVTRMTRRANSATSDFFEFHDVPGAGISRTRGMLILRNPDLVVTLDRASSRTVQQFQTLWHLPSDQVTTIHSRTAAIAAAPGGTSRTILVQVPYKQSLPRGAILVKRGQTSPIQGWHFPSIIRRNAAPTAVFARSGRSATIPSVIAPVSARATVLYRTRLSGTSTIVDLIVGGRPVGFLVSAGGGLVRMPQRSIAPSGRQPAIVSRRRDAGRPVDTHANATTAEAFSAVGQFTAGHRHQDRPQRRDDSSRQRLMRPALRR